MGVGMNRGLTIQGLASMPLKGLLFFYSKTASHFKVEDTMIWHKHVIYKSKDLYTSALRTDCQQDMIQSGGQRSGNEENLKI